MFSRFCHFYSMTDERVLEMPSCRFWVMEHNIARVMAENGLKLLNIATTIQNPDQYTKVVESFSQELGDTYQVSRSAIVKADPGAKAKLKSLM